MRHPDHLPFREHPAQGQVGGTWVQKAALLLPALEQRGLEPGGEAPPLLSLVLNGVCVSLQLCMVLCLIILHHFYPIQSYLM